ncbi:MAG: bifunctional demethylmenaquinone methyltransferase/2-methoxy-6-polyprenyl-1,4-benzoquinol methylase UbiE [Candidatus Delongbacteria bacterium]|nr:MAG: bifunctional demethylmenaquinone methyltransferase/2-methoxy-6-polyprenyl-1,4-benzoquinol methylase UbiE [Candidatus Delongbacteria bacterium]
MKRRDGVDPSKGGSRSSIIKMFNNIAPKYDRLNALFSFGIDSYWRRKALRKIDKSNRSIVLDLGSGTGDIILEAKREGFGKVVCGDISLNMLKVNGSRQKRRFKEIKSTLINSDAESLPFSGNSFKSCIIAFTIRNVERRDRALDEIYRVLDKNGEVVIIEFSIPKSKIISFFYGLYFGKIVKHLGGLLSGDMYAYSYFPDSVETFPTEEEFVKLLKKSNFSNVKIYSLMFGIATIYAGKKI